MTVLPLTPTGPALDVAETDDALTWVRKLSQKLNAERPLLDKLDRYYDGEQPLSFIAQEVREQVGNRLVELVINWPQLVVDTVQRRSYVEGFRLGTGGQADASLWALWQFSDMDEWGQLGQIDSLVHARSFLSVWTAEDDRTPHIAPESAHQMTVAYRPGSRAIAAALKRWVEDKITYATLYLPDRVVRLSSTTRSPLAVNNRWTVDDVLDNPVGDVVVVPLVNRPRLMRPDGRSELKPIVGPADAVNKLATDMMVTSEFHASKRRWATGVEIPPGGDGKARTAAEARQWWDGATAGKTWLAGRDVTFGQFDEASLENFANAIRLLTSQIAAISGLPPHYLGINADNPASADAIRSAEATLVQRAREKHRTWGGAYERAMRFAAAIDLGRAVDELPEEFTRMEAIWRDPETPTVAQAADAAVKLLDAGVYDVEIAQERVGLSPPQREEIANRRASAAAAAATAEIEARMTLARRLQAEDGLTLNAALAAVGLMAAAAANAEPATPANPR